MNTMNVFFIAVWIIVAAEKDEARPNKKTGRAIHYNGSRSRWRTDHSRSCRQKIHKTIRMYCQGPHPDQLQALESFQSKRGTGCGTRKRKRMVLAGALRKTSRFQLNPKRYASAGPE